MSLFETLSLAPILIGTVALLRFIWADSLRFADVRAEAQEAARISRPTVQRLALQADAARVAAENESLSRAA